MERMIEGRRGHTGHRRAMEAIGSSRYEAFSGKVFNWIGVREETVRKLTGMAYLMGYLILS